MSVKKEFKSISAIEFDQENRLWIFRKNSPEFAILNQNGKRITGFKYNQHLNIPKRKEWMPIPTKNFSICDCKLAIIDNWEGILVYDLL